MYLVKTKQWLSSWKNRILILLAIIGPGIIAGSSDMDSPGLTSYSVCGSVFGHSMTWTLIPILLLLFCVLELNIRLGLVSGKGLADLIRENFGLRLTLFVLTGMLISNLGTTVAEFAGVAGSFAIFGINKYISVPLAALFCWLLVFKGSYKFIEKVFLLFSLFLLCYVVSAIMCKPDWSVIGNSIIHPKMSLNYDSVMMMLVLLGTSLCPWMMIQIQNSVVEKELKIENYKYTLIDVILGSVICVVVAFCVIVSCASTLHVQGIKIEEAKDAALALAPLAGNCASIIFAFGLAVASIFAATILPASTAFCICEGLGFEAGMGKKVKEAPVFYSLYTVILIVAAAIILIPNAPLIAITLWSQAINGILLPIVLIYMMILINKEKVMGKYTNGFLGNIIGWGSVVLLVGLSLALVVFSFIK